MSIPKVIHYCWFGGAPKPELIARCIDSWRRFLPGYVIMEWNEQTFDINAHPFAKAMYASRRWAFLSDYVRMWAVNLHGGIYLDTDCEVHASLDSLLSAEAFVGFERFFDSLQPFTACFGARRGHPLVRRCLAYYDSVQPEQGDGTTNTLIVSRIMREVYQVEMQDREQRLADGVVIHPSYALCSPNLWHRAYVTHHFDGSWTSRGKRSKPWHLRLGEKIFRVSPVCLHTAIAGAMGFIRAIFRRN